MKLKKVSIICATLACLILASNAFAAEQQSFVRKVLGGGDVSESIQTSDGSYAYLNDRNITKVNDLSDTRISEVSLTFVDFPYSSFYQYAALHGMAQTLNGFILVGSAQEYGGDAKGIVIKVSVEGRVVWKKLIGVNEGFDAIGFNLVIPTADGGFIVTGWIRRRFLARYPVLIKFSSGGDVVWSKSFDSISSYFLSTPTTDGGVILTAELTRNEG
ncbi:hypothetical protein L0152_16550, partial [bacterium]|nr:hypothetical protein [bacterium]